MNDGKDYGPTAEGVRVQGASRYATGADGSTQITSADRMFGPQPCPDCEREHGTNPGCPECLQETVARETRFGLDMDASEHREGGPYAGAWRHTIGPKGESQMVYRIEAELKLALAREILQAKLDFLAGELDRERGKLCELQGELDEADGRPWA